MRSAGNASIFSIRVLLSAGISVPSTRLLVAFYQHTPPLPMPRPVSRHRAREGADRWSGDIRSFLGCAGLFGKNVLARLTGPGLAANDLARTCSAYPRLRLSRSKAWMAGTRLTAVRFGFLLQLHKGAEGPGTTFGSPWPDLVRPPTSLNVALSTAGKAWLAGTSPAKGIAGCRERATNNRFCSTGQP